MWLGNGARLPLGKEDELLGEISLIEEESEASLHGETR